MNLEKNYIIEKVFFDVNTSNLETAYSIKNNISFFLKNELFPKLELLFKKYSLNNKIIRFDKLSVDFSIEKWSNFEGVKFEICNQLEKELEKQDRQNSKNRIEQIYVLKPESRVQLLSEIENIREIFLFFLKNAYLPWFGKEEHILELSTLGFWKQSIKEKGFIQRLKDLLIKSDAAIERFIYQFADDILITFLLEVNPKFKSYKKSLLKFLHKVNPRIRYSILYLLFQISFSVKRKKILDSVHSFIVLIKENKIAITEDYGFANFSEIIKFIQATSPKSMLADSQYFNEFQSETKAIDLQQNLTEIIIGDKESEQTEKELIFLEDEMDKISVDERENVQNEKEIYDDYTKHVEKGQGEIAVDERKEKEYPFFEKGTGEIAVNNAGLVLLHPFLKQFFIENKIADEEGNILNDKLDLAVQSLHFLATGNENVFEGNLVFEKFLCGIPLNFPVQKKSLLGKKIKEESIILLKELIKNWPALKNSSPEGLRQMFLQRDGKLIHKNEKYKLIVERKAQDLLLAKLNWSISVLKLPWWDTLLFVEW